MGGGSTIVIVILAAIAVALLSLMLSSRAYRRSAMPTGILNRNNEARKQAEQWGVRIDAPVKERTCPRVREFLGKTFPNDARLPLPLPGCPNPHHCECRYVKLFEQRGRQRRSSQERRQEGQRFEKDNPPRRSGSNRRKNGVDWL